MNKDDFYHDGYLKPDYDEWPDHDEDCHGPIDTKENREMYPSRFRWSCCNKLGAYTVGCCVK